MSITGYLYDKNTRGFFPLTEEYTPADGLISIERHAELMGEQELGKCIVPDDQGNPIAVNRPTPTTQELTKMVRSQRDALIEGISWRVERHLSELRQGVQPTEPIEPLDQYIQQLRDVPLQAGFPASITWPEPPTAG